eukprot:Lithocolla_globosa_v1_NODE_8642_length_797_cov_5.159030.p1 type:complete len:112 gc:universal NODE_8642_length_797_cov_5.159030:446-111(-)
MDTLLTRLKSLDIGVRVGDDTLPGFMITDDLVLLAETTCDMKVLLHVTGLFAKEWGVAFHVETSKNGDAKSAVLCFCPPGQVVSTDLFLLGERIPVRTEYRYGGSKKSAGF